MLRKQILDMQSVQAENDKLVRLVREMKRSLIDAPPSPSPVTEVIITEEERERIAQDTARAEEERVMGRLLQKDLIIMERAALGTALTCLSLLALALLLFNWKCDFVRFRLSCRRITVAVERERKRQKYHHVSYQSCEASSWRWERAAPHV